MDGTGVNPVGIIPQVGQEPLRALPEKLQVWLACFFLKFYSDWSAPSEYAASKRVALAILPKKATPGCRNSRDIANPAKERPK